MKLLFVMDELEKIHPQKDSTFLLIKEALRRKFSPFFCNIHHLKVSNNDVLTFCCEIAAINPHKKNFSKVESSLRPSVEMSLDEFDFVFMRKDPPFDLEYLTSLYLLEKASKKTIVVNHPKGLIHCNEKLSTLKFPELCPETLVSSNSEDIKSFLEKHGGKGVIKPIYQAGGEGIFLLQNGDRNLNSILETATSFGKEKVLIQRYLPEVEKGDKRLIVFDGEPVGAVLRIAGKDEIRSNIHVGGKCEKASISIQDKKICEKLKPYFQKEGLFFVGLDLIGNFITEINVTSPTGFQEINRLEDLQNEFTLEAKFFNQLLKKYDFLN